MRVSFGNTLHVIAGGALAACLATVAPAKAASFEGQWSVVVTPQDGRCDGPYVLPVKVLDNRIVYIGKGQFVADGGIESNGSVRVTFASQGDRLDASGKMNSEILGSGNWQSPTENCAGTWVARKR